MKAMKLQIGSASFCSSACVSSSMEVSNQLSVAVLHLLQLHASPAFLLSPRGQIA